MPIIVLIAFGFLGGAQAVKFQQDLKDTRPVKVSEVRHEVKTAVIEEAKAKGICK